MGVLHIAFIFPCPLHTLVAGPKNGLRIKNFLVISRKHLSFRSPNSEGFFQILFLSNMKIGFIIRSDAQRKWGGDLAVVQSYRQGLAELGHESSTAFSPFEQGDADFLLFTNYFLDQRETLSEAAMMGIPFGVLAFQENLLHYYPPATGFCVYVMGCLGHDFETDTDFDLELLFEMPHLVHYYGNMPNRSILYNLDLARKTTLWIANSATEEKTIQRDCPGCKTAVIPVAPGIVTAWDKDPDTSFLQLTGLSSGSYLLQVGRLEMRKNQLGTILATRNLDVPLVFIATRSPSYEEFCFEAAAKWRKAPTLFISQSLAARKEGAARVISMPKKEKLPSATLASAYHHAGLHIHPAFQELPGATYLEAARFGTLSIASHWCTINDYLYDPSLGHAELDGRIVYAEPHHLLDIGKKIEQHFGKKFPPLTEHPALKRTHRDVAQDLLKSLSILLTVQSPKCF